MRSPETNFLSARLVLRARAFAERKISMKPTFRFSATLAATFGAWLALSGAPKHAQADTPRAPVLVELFTSEGCSSCPPADALLGELVRRQPVPGAFVVALGEHVDYWNKGGWTDRFSSHALSARQNDYAAWFHNSTVYTPQMVVDGRTEFVGSDDAKASAAIARAARLPKAQVSVASGAQPGVYTVSVRNLPLLAPGDAADVYLAVTESGVRSHVGGGENRGQTLTHVAVVRSLEKIGTAKAGETFSVQRRLPPSTGERGGSRSVLAFVQARGSRRVLGAALAGRG